VLVTLALPGFVISALLLATVADPKLAAQRQQGAREGEGRRLAVPALPDVGAAVDDRKLHLL
jgi:hypothetical protein